MCLWFLPLLVIASTGVRVHAQNAAQTVPTRWDTLAPLDHADGGWLAVDSEPAGIEVYGPDGPLGQTPLLTPLPARSLAIRVGDVPPLDVRIEPASLTELFVVPGQTAWQIPGGSPELVWRGIPSAGEPVTSLAPGRYRLARDAEPSFILEPLYPAQRRIDSLSAASVLSLAFTAIVGAIEIAADVPSPTRLPLWASAGIGISVAINTTHAVAVHRRSTFLAQYQPMPASDAGEAARIVAAARETGDVDALLAAYESIVERYPRSSLLSEALLELGRQALIDGKRPEALELFARAVIEAPRVTTIDAAGVRLIDLYLANGDEDAARRTLARLPGVQALDTYREVELLRLELLP